MKKIFFCVGAVLCSLFFTVNSTFAQGTAFTYQGLLQNNGDPANGSYDLTFSLYSTNTGGAPIIAPVTNNAVVITNGLFTVLINFGPGVFTGQTNWLQIGVATNGSETFSPLLPRQELTPTPNAIYAENAANFNGILSASQLSSVGNTNGGSGNFFVGPAGNSTTSGADNTAVGASALTCDTSGSDNTANGYFALGFNTSGLDNTVNGYSALFYNMSGSYNTAVGYEALFNLGANTTAGGSNNLALGYLAGNNFKGNESSNIDIGNQGLFGDNNTIRIGTPGIQTNTFIAGVINGNGSGLSNINPSQLSGVIPTSLLPEFQSSDNYATVGGGSGNQATNYYATVGGGNGNITSAGSATVGGGFDNQANGLAAFVGGGQNNQANGGGSFVGGGGYDGSVVSGNVANGAASVVGGGIGNMASANYAIVGGGQGNHASGQNGTVGGGAGNTASGNWATVGGGANNTASGGTFAYATVAGGYGNMAGGVGAFIGGGGNDGIGDIAGNVASGAASVIGGGIGNQADEEYTTVGGGYDNMANGNYATVGGGENNTNYGIAGTIAGGQNNTADAAFQPTVGGGYGNTAIGFYATVPGGNGNTASGEYSFAAGYLAQALDQGAFVWADSQGSQFSSTANNQFLIRAAGGVAINTNNPGAALEIAWGGGLSSPQLRLDQVANDYSRLRFAPSASGSWDIAVKTTMNLYANGGANGGNIMTLMTNGNVGIGNTAPGNLLVVGSSGSPAYCNGTVWQNGSDRNSKQDFAAINPSEVLAKVSALPITEWKYKVDANGMKHLGPMAQDFHAAFGLNGGDDKHIATVDEEGVALAAIQGLNQKLNDRDAEIQDLKQNVAELKKLVQALAEKK